jgi:hypothetical protein
MRPPQRVSHVLPQMLGAAISEADKAAIAWENAARLFRVELPVKATPPLPAS